MDQIEPDKKSDSFSRSLAVSSSPKKSISIRLPEGMTYSLKQIAMEKGIGYQSLIRMWLLEKLEEETGNKP